jgi:hypothetical protein
MGTSSQFLSLGVDSFSSGHVVSDNSFSRLDLSSNSRFSSSFCCNSIVNESCCGSVYLSTKFKTSLMSSFPFGNNLWCVVKFPSTSGRCFGVLPVIFLKLPGIFVSLPYLWSLTPESLFSSKSFFKVSVDSVSSSIMDSCNIFDSVNRFINSKFDLSFSRIVLSLCVCLFLCRSKCSLSSSNTK